MHPPLGMNWLEAILFVLEWRIMTKQVKVLVEQVCTRDQFCLKIVDVI